MTSTLRTAGYDAIMGSVRASHGSDPWGTNMGWLFGLAEARFVWDGVCLPGFRPSPFLERMNEIDDSDSNEAAEIWELLCEQIATVEDIERVNQVLSRYDDWCRAAGINY